MTNQITRTLLVLGTMGCMAFAQRQAAPDTNAANQLDRTQVAAAARDDDADTKLLQAIRQAIVADKELSTLAHNVRIDVKAGAVTLSGPVKSEEEKQKIEQLAKAAGATKVDNLIEIAAPTQS